MVFDWLMDFDLIEFLMTYGWAILVVVAAIAALAYFGVLNPNDTQDDIQDDIIQDEPPMDICVQQCKKISPSSNDDSRTNCMNACTIKYIGSFTNQCPVQNATN